jgi:hypothetical protein
VPRYRFDFLRSEGNVFGTHEIDYDSDADAIAAGHKMNGSPSIGRSFQIWRDRDLIRWHHNVPQSKPAADEVAGTIPRPRHYPNLAALAGVELPSKFAAALSAP